MRTVKFAAAWAAAVLCIVCGGCGKSGPGKVAFGDAPASRRAEFAKAVQRAIVGFEDLEEMEVKVEISGDEVTVGGGKLPAQILEKALSVIVTDFASKYPGVGYAEINRGRWRILVPADVLIPESGEFDLAVK